MKKAILLLGSNLGNKAYYLKSALELITKDSKTNITKKSSIHESLAVGYDSENTYYNQAIEIETKLDPQQLLRLCLNTEIALSRTRSLTKRYTDRTIDIDIILIEGLTINEPNLVVPHPRMHERLFCLKPMTEIASEWDVTTFKKKVKELLVEIENTSELKKVDV